MDGNVIRHFVLSAGVLVALAACSPLGASTVGAGSPPQPPVATTISVPQPWAHEAVGFFEALSSFHPDDVEAFYDPAAFVVGASFTPRLDTRDAIREYRETTHRWNQSVRHVFLGRDRAIVELPVDDWPYDELRSFDMRQGRIAREVRGDRLHHWQEHGATTESAERLQDLYERYVAAWNSGDRARISAIYQPGAVAVDALFGGPVRIGSGENDIGSRPETLLGAGSSYQPVWVATADESRQAETGSVEAAVYSPGPSEAIAELEARSATAGLGVAFAMFDVVTEHQCTLRLVAEWDVHADLIAAEQLFYEVDALRGCLEELDLDPPDGWWTGLQPPDALAETVTGRAATWDGTVVEIVNGSPSQHELARWALERFKAAGLAAPRVATIAFPPTRLCSESGDGAFALVHPTAARVDICLGDFQICPDATCDAIGTHAQRTLLHELGHVWEHQNLDDELRESFLDQRDLSAWTDSGAKWHERGSEQAAEALAWGLMEHPIITMIPHVTPDELAAGFRLLTATEPLHAP